MGKFETVFCFDTMMDFVKEIMKNRFLLFLVVGGVNTLFGYGVFAWFIFIGVNYAVAVLLATIMGIVFNFKTTGTIVFRSHNNRLIVRFFSVYGILYVLGVTYLTILKPYFNIYLIQAVFLPPMAFLAFFLNKKFVYIDSRLDILTRNNNHWLKNEQLTMGKDDSANKY